VITLSELRLICPHTKRAVLERFVEPLNATAAEREINTPPRLAAFLAQVAHESGGFMYVRELASGAAYEGRIDLGNIYPGDGVRFAGRGLIQVTGRSNYTMCSRSLFGNDRLLGEPHLLEQPLEAARSAGWFWSERRLNELADAGDFTRITRRINGGLTHQDRRLALLKLATLALGQEADGIRV
jgi:putative chitinase